MVRTYRRNATDSSLGGIFGGAPGAIAAASSKDNQTHQVVSWSIIVITLFYFINYFIRRVHGFAFQISYIPTLIPNLRRTAT